MALLDENAEVGTYRVVRKLATGGMAEVYLARQTGPLAFSKNVVLKVILPHLAEDPQFLRMFQTEAQLAALINHPNVVQIFDAGTDATQGIHYIAMEYIDGLSLRRMEEQLEVHGERFPLSLALRVVCEACRGLHYAHTLRRKGGEPLNIVHRDIALDNILVSVDGQTKLVDFGIAKAMTSVGLTRTGELKGKFQYMAPEMLRGELLDLRVDVYALGVVLFRLLLGQWPFNGSSEIELLDNILEQPLPAPRGLDPGLADELETILVRALHKDRSRRYPSADALENDLEGYLAQIGGATRRQLSRFLSGFAPADHVLAAGAHLPDVTGDSMPSDLATDLLPALTPTRLGAAELTPTRLGAAELTPTRLGAAELTPTEIVGAALTPTRLGAAELTPTRLDAVALTPSRPGPDSRTPAEPPTDPGPGLTPTRLAPVELTPTELPTDPGPGLTPTEAPTNPLPSLPTVPVLSREAPSPVRRPESLFAPTARSGSRAVDAPPVSAHPPDDAPTMRMPAMSSLWTAAPPEEDQEEPFFAADLPTGQRPDQGAPADGPDAHSGTTELRHPAWVRPVTILLVALFILALVAVVWFILTW